MRCGIISQHCILITLAWEQIYNILLVFDLKFKNKSTTPHLDVENDTWNLYLRYPSPEYPKSSCLASTWLLIFTLALWNPLPLSTCACHGFFTKLAIMVTYEE
jgi:hypothetical protein